MTDIRGALFRISRIVRKELRQLFRDPKTKGVIFVSPIIQLLLFGYAVNTDVRDLSTFVVDQDHSVESRALLDAMTATGHFRITGRSDRPADLTGALDAGSAKVGVEIPPGFAEALRSGRSAPVQILLDGTNSNTATIAQGYLAKIVQSASLGTGGRSSDVAGGVDLRTRAWFNPDLASRVYNVPAVIGVIVLLMSLLLTAMSVVRERELGTLEQLMVSPLNASELILGKTIPVAGIAMVQLTLVTTVAMLWFGIPFRGSVIELVLAAVLFIVGGLSAGLLISTISSTQQEAFLGMFLFILPTIVLSGFLYPVESMPEIFQHLTLLNPLRHFLEIVRGIFLKGGGIAEFAPQYLALLLLAALGVGYAVRRFARSLI